MNRSAIILAGGFSSRFGQDKGMLMLVNKPLLRYVTDAIDPIVDEIIVVVNSEEKAAKYSEIVKDNVRFTVDICESQGPLIGALTGLKTVKSKYTLLLPFDTPFISPGIINLLFELCLGKAAAIPRWPNTQIEPLQAVYQSKLALEAAVGAVNEGYLNMRALIVKLRGVRYISTMVIQELDPDLRTFFNVNTPLDMKRACMMIQSKNQESQVRTQSKLAL
jgi:molybdenum cofactor guanylyltransferase